VNNANRINHDVFDKFFTSSVERNFMILIMKYMMKVPIIILLLLMKKGVMEISFVI
jgi:hypothetical protein